MKNEQKRIDDIGRNGLRGKVLEEKSCRVRETDYNGAIAVTVYMDLSRLF